MNWDNRSKFDQIDLKYTEIYLNILYILYVCVCVCVCKYTPSALLLVVI